MWSLIQLCRLIVPHQCNPTIYCVILLIGEAQFFCFLFYNLVFYLLLGFFVCFFTMSYTKRFCHSSHYFIEMPYMLLVNLVEN